jgi:hypothetical protein
MKIYHVYLFRVSVLIFLSVMLVGCSTRTHMVKSDELLPEPTGSPLKSVSPKTFSFKEFKDIRKVVDPMLLMKAVLNEWRMEQATQAMIATAIKREFEMNGHICIADTPQSKPDFIVEGTVYKYQVVGGAVHLFSQDFLADVAVKLTVSSASDMNRVLTKNYEGKYTGSGASVGAGTLRSCQMGGLRFCDLLKAALFEMVKEISTDPDLVAFIEK